MSEVSPITERVRQEFEKWFDAARSQGEKAMDAIGVRGGRSGGPAVDVVEQQDRLVVEIDVPGVCRDAIDLSLTGHLLTVAGRFPEATAGEIHTAERAHGEFKRSIALPSTVDCDSIKAEHRDGVLRVTINKTPSESARKISIEG